MTPRKLLAPLSDVDEAEIQRQIAADPDDAEATDAELAQAKPFAAAFPAGRAAEAAGQPEAVQERNR